MLHVISGLGLGGAERSLYLILKKCSVNPSLTTVITLTPGGYYCAKIKNLGVNVLELNLTNLFSVIFSTYKVIKLVRMLKFRVIQGWLNHGIFFASLLYFFSPKPTFLLWNIRQSMDALSTMRLSTRVFFIINKFLSKAADVIVFNSNYACIQFNNYGYRGKSQKIIPNGINFDNYIRSDVVRNNIRCNLDISKETILIGHVARFDPMKDHLTFLRSAIHLLKNSPNIKFLLIGKGVDFNNSFFKNNIPLKIRKNFTLAGNQEKIQDYYQAMDMLCLTSISEAFPNVLLEGVAFGLPCITTNVGDVESLIRDSDRIINSGDYNSLSREMKRLSLLSDTERNKIGAKDKSKAISRFNINRVCNDYKEVIDYERKL